MWEPEGDDAGSVACGDSRRAGWPQRARVLARLLAAGRVARQHLHVLTQVAKKCLAQFTGAGIAEDGSLTAASNSWRANGVTNYTNRP
jgi:hypothetical protein